MAEGSSSDQKLDDGRESVPVTSASSNAHVEVEVADEVHSEHLKNVVLYRITSSLGSVLRRFKQVEELRSIVDAIAKDKAPSLNKKMFHTLLGSHEDRAADIREYVNACVAIEEVWENQDVARFLRDQYFSDYPCKCRLCHEMVDAKNVHPDSRRGYLSKQGQVGVGDCWKRRYFIFANFHLAYYSNENVVGFEPPKGVVHIVSSWIQLESEQEGDAENKFCFSLNLCDGRQMIMGVSSEEERRAWIQEIARIKTQAPQEMKREAGEPGHIGSGLVAAGKDVGHGFIDGFKGVVNKPIEGAKEAGFLGAVKGVGKGVAGFVAQPVLGIGRAAKHVVQGAVNTPSAVKESWHGE